MLSRRSFIASSAASIAAFATKAPARALLDAKTPKQCGAVGDGLTDDTEALHRFLSQFGSRYEEDRKAPAFSRYADLRGGFGAPVYKITKPLEIMHSYLHVDFKGVTLLPAGTAAININKPDGDRWVRGVVLDSPVIRGQTDDCGNGITAWSAPDLEVTNGYIEGMLDGISLYAVVGGRVNRTVSTLNRRNGAVLSSCMWQGHGAECMWTFMDKVRLLMNGRNGLEAVDGGNLRLDVDVELNQRYGAHFDSVYSTHLTGHFEKNYGLVDLLMEHTQNFMPGAKSEGNVVEDVFFGGEHIDGVRPASVKIVGGKDHLIDVNRMAGGLILYRTNNIRVRKQTLGPTFLKCQEDVGTVFEE